MARALNWSFNSPNPPDAIVVAKRDSVAIPTVVILAAKRRPRKLERSGNPASLRSGTGKRSPAPRGEPGVLPGPGNLVLPTVPPFGIAAQIRESPLSGATGPLSPAGSGCRAGAAGRSIESSPHDRRRLMNRSLLSRASLLSLLCLVLAACTNAATSAATSTAPAPTPVSQLPAATTPTPSLISPASATATAALPGSSTVLAGHLAPVTLAAWSPNGQLLATSAGDWQSPDPSIRLWRSDGSLVKVLRGHTAPVRSLAWSPDGQLLASASLDTTVRLWKPDGTLAATLHGSQPAVAVAWSPDGRLFASASAPTLNPIVQLWRRAGTPLAALSTQYTGGKFYNLAWSPDGKFLLGGAVDYKVWRADGAELFHLEACAHCTPAWGAAWSPDSQRWAVGNESGNVGIYDVAGRLLAQVHNEHGNVDALAWSPDGHILAGGDGVNLWRNDGSLLVAHASFGRVNGLLWSPDGKLLASTSTDNGLRLWGADGKLLAAFPGSVINVAWSPDGQLLAAFSEGNTVRLWQLQSSNLLH